MPDCAIVISFASRNLDKAIDTAQRLALVSSVSCLVLETEERRETLPADLRSRLGNWNDVWLWDRKWTEMVLKKWPSSLPFPFFEKVSYGGNVNHLLILLSLINRRYAIRFDPGSWPLDDPGLFVVRHRDDIAVGRILSGQYSDRVALRDDFIIDDEQKREDYYAVMQAHTGVNPRRGHQVTGGASLMRPVGSKPDIAFNGVMVWASDDGFLQQFYGTTEAAVDGTETVGRNSTGYPQECDQYVGRLVNAVVLHQCEIGTRDRAAILGIVRAFLNELKLLVKEPRVPEIDSIDAGATPIEAILSGYDNHCRLKVEWPVVVAEATRRLRGGSVSQLE